MQEEIKCPSCGANVTIENTENRTRCSYCGAEIHSSAASGNTNAQEASATRNATAQNGADVSELLREADRFISMNAFAQAETLYMRAIQVNPADYRGYYGMVKARLQNFTNLYDLTHVEFLERAKQVANPEQRAEIQQDYWQRKYSQLQILGQSDPQKKKRRMIRNLIIACVSIFLVVAIAITASVVYKATYCFGNYGVYVNTYKVKTFVIPKGVTELESGAFKNCKETERIFIPAHVTKIEEGAFEGYKGVIYCEAESRPVGWNQAWNTSGCAMVWGYRYVTVKGVTYGIRGDAATVVKQPTTLSGDIALQESITYEGLSYPVTQIAGSAFYDCKDVTSVVIPRSVTKVGSSAFHGCERLATIYCEATKKPVGWDYYWNNQNRPVVWGYTGN